MASLPMSHSLNENLLVNQASSHKLTQLINPKLADYSPELFIVRGNVAAVGSEIGTTRKRVISFLATRLRVVRIATHEDCGRVRCDAISAKAFEPPGKPGGVKVRCNVR